MDRLPFPFIQMNPQDMAELKLKAGDLVEVYNDNGATQAMVYPTPTARRKQTFMLFANPDGVQGNVVSQGVNELIIPNYKQTWGNSASSPTRRKYTPLIVQDPGVQGRGLIAGRDRTDRPNLGESGDSDRPAGLRAHEFARRLSDAAWIGLAVGVVAMALALAYLAGRELMRPKVVALAAAPKPPFGFCLPS